jgi:adenylate kinase family enzyme
MKLIDFNDYLKKNGLTGQDDETVTASLIQSLVQETIPRIVLENFPQNVKQAKYFLRNGTTPSHVFSLNCLKDMCQERMLELGEANPGYVPSSILSKKIKKYHDDSKELLPFLAESTNLVDVNTDQALDKSMEEVYRNIEPLVIHVRPGAGGGNELRREIVEKLSAEHGFVNLDVDKIQRGENERGTNVGKELQRLVEQSKVVPAETTVRMLNKIIYSGQPSQDKFILSSFPDIIDQA